MPYRMFVALVPPARVKEHLAEFLSARPQRRWIDEDQWHLTLAFMAAVPDHREEDLTDAVAAVAARHQPFELRLAGAGAFPHPGSARALWLGGHAQPASGGDPLTHLATSCRAAASSVGAPPDGKGFTAHLTLARLRRPVEATKWLRVLETFEDSWRVDEVELIASHLGEGPNRRPRYQTRARLPLGGPRPVRGS